MTSERVGRSPRRLGGLAAGLVALVLLPACGGDDDDAGGSGAGGTDGGESASESESGAAEDSALDGKRVVVLAEEFVLADVLDEATERAREAVPDDCRVSLAAIYPGPSPAAFVAGPWDLPTSVLSTGCTVDPDPSVAEPDENGRVYLSLEQLGMLDAPTLVLLQSETVEGEQEAVEQIEANPLWSELPAVRDDNVVVFDRLGYPGAGGQIRFLEDFAALFA